MANYNKGILGAFSGKVGNVEGEGSANNHLLRMSILPASSQISLRLNSPLIGSKTTNGLQPGDPGYVEMTCCHNAVKLKKVTVKVKYLDQEQISVTLCDSTADRYRFGFNGQEKVNEWAGIGNHLSFEARGYDSRLGRWLSVDPLFKIQPSQSTYKSFLNNPILMADPDGKKEYITTITYDKRTGNTTVKIHTGNTIMTDGVKHRVWDNSVDYHWENNYYDYSTIIYQTTNDKGKTSEVYKTTTILKHKGVKDSDNVWFGGNNEGDWKIESWSKALDIKEYVGGIMIYGSDRDGTLSPGDKKFNGKILGSFDFGGFMDIFNLATVGITNPTITDTKFDGESFANIVNNAKDAAEQYQKEEREKVKKIKPNSTFRCETCNDNFQRDDAGNETYERSNEPAGDTIPRHGHK